MTTKEFIILEAFKLYVSKPYEQVTFAELEKVTGLSRGALLYHFKSKELLFNTIIEQFVLKESSVGSLIQDDCNKLLDFIKRFIAGCKGEMRRYRTLGVDNINLAKLYMEFHALSHYENMQQLAKSWIDKERAIWAGILSKAVESNEVRDDISVETLAVVFVDIYQGASFTGISRPHGYDIALLEKEFMIIYNLIKKK